MTAQPSVNFNNGFSVPLLGLGTWKSKPEEVQTAVEYAVDIGYRHLDCAYLYENEKEVGTAVAKKIGEGVVKREDLFITSKLWNTFHSPELVEPAIRLSLANLQLDYLDLYLIHCPIGYKESNMIRPTDESGNAQFSFVDYVDTWKALEAVVEKGLARSIGISNFNKRQTERIMAVAEIKPVTNQVECHPWMNQNRLIEACKRYDIILTAFSPLGCPGRPWAKPGDPELLEDAKLKAIADRLGRTPAQILIRYQIDRGIIVIPKSVNKRRIKENFDVLNFKLTPEDMKLLDSFDCNERIFKMDWDSGHPHHPFEHDEF